MATLSKAHKLNDTGFPSDQDSPGSPYFRIIALLVTHFRRIGDV